MHEEPFLTFNLVIKQEGMLKSTHFMNEFPKQKTNADTWTLSLLLHSKLLSHTFSSTMEPLPKPYLICSQLTNLPIQDLHWNLLIIQNPKCPHLPKKQPMMDHPHTSSTWTRGTPNKYSSNEEATLTHMQYYQTFLKSSMDKHTGD